MELKLRVGNLLRPPLLSFLYCQFSLQAHLCSDCISSGRYNTSRELSHYRNNTAGREDSRKCATVWKIRLDRPGRCRGREPTHSPECSALSMYLRQHLLYAPHYCQKKKRGRTGRDSSLFTEACWLLRFSSNNRL